jgi:thiamine-monophosphate kinase
MPGEFDFISWIRSQQRASDFVQLPAGDDLAILKWKAEDLLLVGVDQVLDGVHFDSSVHSPRQIGKKVMNRNLSDCAAMACLPAAAVATVALPKGSSLDYGMELYLGMKEAADVFGCKIVGGDTATWSGRLAVTVSILARSAGVNPVRRSGAKPGDNIFVTGPIGGSRLGRHMNFIPRIREAHVLAKLGGVTAMIDISDGLSRDLAHICSESDVGAVIRSSLIPIHEDARNMPGDEYTPLEHALHDGEDHELLYTWTGEYPEHPKSLRFPDHGDVRCDLIRIGMITNKPGVFLETDGELTPLTPKGWEHRF